MSEPAILATIAKIAGVSKLSCCWCDLELMVGEVQDEDAKAAIASIEVVVFLLTLFEQT